MSNDKVQGSNECQMTKLARSDEQKVNQFQINVKLQNARISHFTLTSTFEFNIWNLFEI